MTVETMVGLFAAAFGFSVGAIPFGVVVGAALGVNVRTSGSGNIGATNVARTAGKRAGIVVLLLDAAKGAGPILVYLHLAVPRPDGYWLLAVGMAPILGHCFSPWLRFAGGKGVATALGVFAALAPYAALTGVGTFAVIYLAFRVASLGSLAGAAAIAVYLGVADGWGPALALGLAALALIVIRHRGNIARLARRVELRV